MMNFLKSVAVLCMVTLVFACSKETPAPGETPPPTNPPTETEDLREQLLGKWTFDGAGFSLTAAVSTQQVSVRGVARAIVKKMELGATEAPTTEAFIEFLEDNTYVVLDGNGDAYSGSFKTEGDKVTLTNLGDITEITIEDGKISFKFTHAETKKTSTVAASKADPIKSDDRTTALSRTWELLPEADGREIFEEPLELWNDDEDEPFATINVERVTVTFSASGSYIIRIYAEGGELVETDVSNWKWHSTDPNRFVYSWAGWEVDEYEDYVEILELNANSLKLNESWVSDNGPESLTLHFKAHQS